ncbi:DUF3089 domain-containing protein [Limnobacter parvus]|uniref:DUF3089 domain-containing protein n=1 Tax=Limnobacter parvus TaxID=2939690 RepID=A0ABT1XE71_9BURK|nr:DUF3089 domain-containing protein [Limnobacter parvus]
MIHRFLISVATTSILLSACGGDSSNGSTNTRVGASAANVTNPFPGYQSTLYTGTSNWLCHPDLFGNSNVCNGNFDSTVVAADATAIPLTYTPATEPPVDCFYVYPTTSIDLAGNSDLNDDLQEQQTTALQFGRYGEVCRQFAPVYRQRTLTALGLTTFTGALGGIDIAPNAGEVAYADVLDAFKEYIANQSEGRGFILVGHSQGSGILRRLIAEEIETRPELLRRLIAAHIPGTNVLVPTGQNVGASFQQVPACRSANQIGCVVAYVTYRAGDPQLEDPRFGLSAEEGTQALCTNPAALAGGQADLFPIIPRQQPPVFRVLLIPRGPGGPYVNPISNLTIPTPYYSIPGQVKGECKVGPNGVSYLEASIVADPDDPRADDYPGEFIGGTNWGFHLIDVSIAQGDLVRLAQRQANAWLNAAR